MRAATVTESPDGSAQRRAAALIWQRLQIPLVCLTAYADIETLAAIKRTNASLAPLIPFGQDRARVGP